MLSADSNLVEVNCMNGNKACNNMRISNDQANSMKISCNTTNNNSDPVCDSLDITVADGATVNLDCYAQGICNNISIQSAAKPAASISINISVYDKGQLTNSHINGTTTDSLSLYASSHGIVSMNRFLFDNAKSSVDIVLYNNANLNRNDFHVLHVPNISILSHSDSGFSNNYFYGDSNTFVDIRNVLMENSNINVSNAVHLNVYNSQFRPGTIISADNVHFTNITGGIIDHSILNISHNNDVQLNHVSLNNAHIFATNVKHNIAINIGRNATVWGNSVVDAKYANNFSLICHASCAEHFALYTNPGKAFITCIAHGCASLDLYTQHNTDDITFIPLECPCAEDMETACIDSWDIYCNYNATTDKYMNKSQFISATQCIDKQSKHGICCGGILEAMHEKKCGDNDYFICPSGQQCIIDCKNISESHTAFNNFSCNTKQSIINGTHATALTVLCDEGAHGCTNLTVFCPDASNAMCNVNCDGANGCNSLTIDGQSTGTAHNQLSLHCSANESCVDVAIINSDLTELKCSNNGCLRVNVDTMNSLRVDCTGGVCDGLLLDCTQCANFTLNCAEHGICSNSILHADNASHFALQCSSDNDVNALTGCHNITAYIPPHDTEKRAAISCDYYGCNALDLFILDARITDDINFNVNCPCESDIDSLCINRWNLYCNGDMSQPSVFGNGLCDGKCCGDVIEVFHEPQCSPFNCAVLNNGLCIINCTDLLYHEYICENAVIDPNTAVGLNLYCNHNVNCSNLEVYCPLFNSNKHANDAVCNIYCDGEDNCKNMRIHSNGINQFNFECNGQCNDISIVNNHDNDNILSINCTQSQCNNMNISGIGHSNIDIICEDNCTFNQLIINTSQAKQLFIHGNGKAIISNSIFNICNFTVSDALFSHNILDGSSCITQNISFFENNVSSNVIKSPKVHRLWMDIMACSFSNNSLSVDNVQQFDLNLTGVRMNNNIINGDNLHSNTMFMSSQSVFVDNILNGMHANKIMISNEGIWRDNVLNANNVQMLTYIGGTLINNTMNINSANNTLINGTMIDNIINGNNVLNISFLNMNEGGVIIGNIFNMDNASNALIANKYIYASNLINANNISTFIFECSGNYIECGTNAETDYFNLNHSQQLIRFTIGGMADNLLFGGFGGNILAENAHQMQLNIGTHTHIDNINNTLLINAYNASIFIINNYGSLQNVAINASLSKQIAIINYESGVINGGVLFGEQSAVNIINNGNLHKTIINAQNSSDISLKCADNSICNVAMNANYATNVAYNAFATKNEKNIINYNGDNNFNLDLNANNAHSVNVSIDAMLSHIHTNINAQYAESIIVSVSVDGLLNNSIINGKNATRLAVECGGRKSLYGCHNVSIISSAVMNGVPSSYLSCVQYGCQNLVLYTRKDASDLNVTGSECPCDEDLKNLCINEWQIHCKNATNEVSIFSGLKNCTGNCCGSVHKELKEDYCEVSHHKSKKIKSWVYIVIGVAGFCLIGIVIAVFYKKRKKRSLLLNQDTKHI